MTPPIGSARAGLRSVPADAIPDSEANQKLVHRWYLSEDSPPFIDQIGTSDSTSVTGTTQVVGDWVDNAAREGDGVDDVIETTDWGGFGSDMGNGFAIAFSVNVASTTTSYIPLGVVNSTFSDTFLLTALNGDDGDGTIRFTVQDDNNVTADVYAGSISANTNHRIVVNAPTTDASDMEIYQDQTQLSTTITQNNTASSFSNFSRPVTILARNKGGTIDAHTDGVVDDVCVFGDSLTSTEATSYNAPWE